MKDDAFPNCDLGPDGTHHFLPRGESDTAKHFCQYCGKKRSELIGEA